MGGRQRYPQIRHQQHQTSSHSSTVAEKLSVAAEMDSIVIDHGFLHRPGDQRLESAAMQPSAAVSSISIT